MAKQKLSKVLSYYTKVTSNHNASWAAYDIRCCLKSFTTCWT